jgi:murein DD-endopeptidase MepM/ murein hydrolase activator NlpD
MAEWRRSLLVLVAFLTTMAVSACSGPRVASTYRSRDGVSGGRRSQLHNGIDIRDRYGTDVLAAADGEVLQVRTDPICGIGVFLSHKSFGRYELGAWISLKILSQSW